jgi:hypothetical protein
LDVIYDILHSANDAKRVEHAHEQTNTTDAHNSESTGVEGGAK